MRGGSLVHMCAACMSAPSTTLTLQLFGVYEGKAHRECHAGKVIWPPRYLEWSKPEALTGVKRLGSSLRVVAVKR